MGVDGLVVYKLTAIDKLLSIVSRAIFSDATALSRALISSFKFFSTLDKFSLKDLSLSSNCVNVS